MKDEAQTQVKKVNELASLVNELTKERVRLLEALHKAPDFDEHMARYETHFEREIKARGDYKAALASVVISLGVEAGLPKIDVESLVQLGMRHCYRLGADEPR